MKPLFRIASALAARALTVLLIVGTVCAAIVTPAQAATQYRDRYIPGAVCMVQFNGATINAGLIQEVAVLEPFASDDPAAPARTLRVTMVNSIRYDQDLPKEQAGAAKAEFLKMLKRTCK